MEIKKIFQGNSHQIENKNIERDLTYLTEF